MMNITPYHARYFANEISCRRTDENRLSQSLFDAKVDLNPHQIDAALFALKNPLQEGVLLADEVGLGKTIEAGLVICQMWAERKRKLLIVCPAILRKQWANELAEKFNLPTLVVDKAVVMAEMRQKSGSKLLHFCKNHLEQQVMIVSHQYATKEMATFKQFDWDLVVIDEAHKMRNAYKIDNKMGKAMRQAFGGKRKLLLTATPLQNSLMELYGLSTLLDEHLFGDKKFFQKEFVRKGNLSELKSRMAKFIKRTLRKNVLEYVRYTERKTITQEFMPSDAEQQLYEAISDFLHKETIYALPKQHKHLTALILRKLLASSPQAVLGTLCAILDRLLSLKNTGELSSELAVVDELLADESVNDEDLDADEETSETGDTLNLNALDKEIREIEGFIRLAESLVGDSKLNALLKALQTGFGEMAKLGAAQKAIIFTESVRTQHYLYDFLLKNGYADQVVMFSGTNNDAQSTQIYHDWLVRNAGTEKVTGSVDVDKRSSLIAYFSENAQIMIATEAASEGVNLQFCSLLINYDLPWNPQRVEQRIGRCHRYGQKFDVVVVNFLNKRNLADQRVLELLTEKFKLFQGVLGASDEVLGQIESGVDIENQIANIYATCRTEKAIQHAFDELQAKFADRISDRMKETQEVLMERFDQSVLDRLKVMARERLSAMEQWFWGVTQFALADKATFNHSDWYFLLNDSPVGGVSLGRYLLPKKNRSQQIAGQEYRLHQPLGQYCVQVALNAQTPDAALVFDYAHYPEKISLLERYQGQSGWLKLDKICVTSPVEKQDALVFSVCDQNGNAITDSEFSQRLFSLSAKVQSLTENPPLTFADLIYQQIGHAKQQIQVKNDALLKTEMLRIQAWAKDQMQAAEDLILEIKEEMRAKERELVTENDLARQINLQESISKLRKQLRKARNELDDVQDEIQDEEMHLLKALRAKTQQTMEEEKVFLIQWRIV